MNRFILLLIAVILCAAPVCAQGLGGPSSSDQPIEITADKTLEWLRNDKQFIARDNAKAKQGDVSIAAQTLTADYRDGDGSGLEIYKMKATDNVVISSRENNAYGDMATYEVDQGLAVMTGDNLKMTSPDQTLTARDKFEYWVTDGRLVALGDAKIIRPKPTGGTDTLRSDKISALLKENAKGQRVLHSMEAIGNVVITTPTEVITGAYGIYKADTNTAEIKGDVIIKRGPNILEGERAEVDMNTNTSRMFGSAKTGGQVRGVFYPNSEKKSGGQ
ncbi:MAG: ostA-like family protein [Alphaproteobacteria bacterium]|nr:ostA-like family protein [Alphaproteobacteria bacterium]